MLFLLVELHLILKKKIHKDLKLDELFSDCSKMASLQVDSCFLKVKHNKEIKERVVNIVFGDNRETTFSW